MVTMFYSSESSCEWKNKYGILSEGLECPQCKSALRLSRPFVIKGYRGLEAEACSSCGHDSGFFRVVPVDEEKLAVWESLRP